MEKEISGLEFKFFFVFLYFSPILKMHNRSDQKVTRIDYLFDRVIKKLIGKAKDKIREFKGMEIGAENKAITQIIITNAQL